jgi:hypothetical protein
VLITTNAPTSRPALGSEPLCPVLASSEVGILLRQLAHSISVSEAMSTAAARCQQGALVVLEKDFVARGGGVPGAAYSTGRGERYIFRLLIQFRISVMLRTLLLCSCQYVLVLVLCWFCESAGPELVTKSGAVHPGGVAEFVLRIKRRLRCVPRFPFFPSPPLEASEGTPNCDIRRLRKRVEHAASRQCQPPRYATPSLSRYTPPSRMLHPSVSALRLVTHTVSLL